MRRFLALLLTASMLLSMMPAVYAEGEEQTVTEEPIAVTQEASAPVTAEPPVTEAEPEETPVTDPEPEAPAQNAEVPTDEPETTVTVDSGEGKVYAAEAAGEVRQTVQIPFELDGGTGTAEPFEVVSGETFIMPMVPVTKQGCSLSGWVLQRENGTVLNQAGEYTPADMMFLALIFRGGETYTAYEAWFDETMPVSFRAIWEESTAGDTETVTPPAECTYDWRFNSTNWDYDENGHGLVCSRCYDRKVAPHDGDPCTVCGYFTHTHDHNYIGHNASEYGHEEYCSICGRRTSEPHTNGPDGKCTICGYYAHNHNYVWDISHYRYENHHDVECTICGIADWASHTGDPCTVCGYKTHAHTWMVVRSDATFHWLKCSYAGCDESRRESHNLSDGEVCQICSYVGHTHELVYHKDYGSVKETGHTLHCGKCFEVIDYEAPHTMNAENVCTVCGYTPHAHNFVWDRRSPEAFGDYYICTDCGMMKDVPHSLKLGETCSVCGYTASAIKACNHEYQYSSGEKLEWGHYLTCIHCDNTKREAHIFGENGSCSVCGYTPHSHVFQVRAYLDIGCHSLLCNFCDVQRPEPHSFNKDQVCTVCGLKKHFHTWKAIKGEAVDMGHWSECADPDCTARGVAPHDPGVNPCSCGYETHEVVAQGSCGDNLTWVLDENGVLTISGTGTMTSCPWHEYINRSSVREVVFPEGLTTIVPYAFSSCSGLTSVTIPAEVTDIGEYAFSDCAGLKTVEFLGNAPSIGNEAFYNVTAEVRYDGLMEGWRDVVGKQYGGRLNWVWADADCIAKGFCGDDAKWVLNKNGVLTISGTGTAEYLCDGGYYAYTDGICEAYSDVITEIVVQPGITRIGGSLFRYCKNAKAVTIPSTVTSIGENAFYDCKAIEVLKIEDLGAWLNVAFEGSTSNPFAGSGIDWDNIGSHKILLNGSVLRNAEIPDSVTRIPDYAFAGCRDLVSVTIPVSMQGICAHAFDGCISLSEVRLPEGMRKILSYAFRDCSSLRKINLPITLEQMGTYVFSGCSSLAGINWPVSIASIPEWTFEDCKSLKHFDIPEGITTIGNSAFNSTGLTEIILPDSLRAIGSQAFWACKPDRVELGNGVQTIGDSAFMLWNTCPKVRIPASVQKIGASAASQFECVILEGTMPAMNQNCFGNAKIVIYPADWGTALTDGMKKSAAPNAEWIANTGGAVLKTGTLSNGINWYLKQDGTLAVTGKGAIPDYTYNSPAPWAAYNSLVETIQIGDGITDIGKYAFYRSSAMSVSIPSSVKRIGECAFEQAKLKEVVIPSGVTEIDGSAFSGCNRLSHMVIPASVTTMGGGVVRQSEDARLLRTAGPIGSGCDLEFGWTTKIPNNAFCGSSLKTITIPDGITAIGEFAFESCKATDIYLGKNVNSIGSYAFNSVNGNIWFIGKAPSFNPYAFLGATVTAYYPKGDASWTAAKRQNYGGKVTWIAAEPALGEGTQDNLQWKVSADGTLTVSGTGEIPDYASPAGAPWYRLNGSIRTLKLDAGITAIGENAFAGLTGLTRIVFPGEAPAMAENAFAGVNAAAEYNCVYGSWKTASQYNYGGNLIWKPQHGFVNGVCIICSEPAYAQTITVRSESGKTVLLPGDTLSMAADVEPVEANPAVSWSVTAGEEYASILPSGVVAALQPGKFTVTAAALDGSGVTGSLELEVVSYHVAGSEAFYECNSGKSVQLSASLQPYNMTATKLVWSLEPGSERFASITAAGRLTAKTITEEQTIYAIAAAADGRAEAARIPVILHPYAAAVVIRQGDEVVTGKTLTVDVNSSVDSLTFRAECMPFDAMGDITWKWSDTPDKYGNYKYGDYVDNGDGSITVFNPRLPSAKAATVTLTAKAMDGSGKTAVVKLSLCGRVQAGELTVTGMEENSGSNPLRLRGGAGYTFKTAISTGNFLTDKTVTWSLADARDAAYASVSAAGKLTTKAVGQVVNIVLLAAPKSNPDAAVPVYVQLVPAVQKVTLTADHPTVDGIVRLDLNESDTVELEGVVFPENAKSEGTWKSSNAAIAKVAEGTVTFLKPGTVTITFTASDGSKKAASVKIHGRIPVSEITIADSVDSLTSGGRTTLKAAVDADATLKSVAWSSSDTAAAVIGSTGVVTAKTVYVDTEVTFTAAAKDGSGVTASRTLTIKPKANVLAVTDSSGNILNGKTIFADLSDSGLSFAAGEEVTWISGNPAIAAVENGELTILKGGSVAITAKSLDGLRSGKFTLKISTLVSSLEISPKVVGASNVLTSGKGKLTLAAIPNSNATVKSVTWSSSDPSAAAVSATGVVSAKAGVLVNTDVVITATAKDGSGVSDVFPVTVIPCADLVTVHTAGAVNTLNLGTIPADEVMNGRTMKVDLDVVSSVSLGAVVYPNEADRGANEAVTWKTSSASIAAVDQEGNVTLLKPGTVTITATAKDGSGKYASVKITAVRYAKSITFTTPDSQILGGGCKLALKYTLNTESGEAPSSKGVLFSLRTADTVYASVSSTGVVTAKNVTAPHTIQVTVTAKDSPDISTSIFVRLMPKVTGVNIRADGEIVNGKTLKATVGDSVILTADTLPVTAGQGILWTVSNRNYATVTEDGVVTGLLRGTVTVTAKATDGSGKYAQVKITVQ